VLEGETMTDRPKVNAVVSVVVSPAQLLALQELAELQDVRLSVVVRRAFSAYTGVPDEIQGKPLHRRPRRRRRKKNAS
jgi:hypothetical protein